MNGCRDCQNSTSGVCPLHAVQTVTANVSGVYPPPINNETERLRDALAYCLYLTGDYITSGNVRLALIAKRCRDALKGYR